MGDEAAHWLSQYLNVPCRLVFMPESTRRSIDADYSGVSDTVSFADGFPILLISEASLAELSTRLKRPVSMSRFRPNIVISGCDAFAEDGWKSIRINEVEFSVAKACARCSMPTIDQNTAEIDREIMTGLAEFRRAKDKQIYLGQNLINQGEGTIHVGDEVLISD